MAKPFRLMVEQVSLECPVLTPPAQIGVVRPFIDPSTPSRTRAIRPAYNGADSVLVRIVVLAGCLSRCHGNPGGDVSGVHVLFVDDVRDSRDVMNRAYL